MAASPPAGGNLISFDEAGPPAASDPFSSLQNTEHQVKNQLLINVRQLHSLLPEVHMRQVHALQVLQIVSGCRGLRLCIPSCSRMSTLGHLAREPTESLHFHQSMDTLILDKFRAS